MQAGSSLNSRELQSIHKRTKCSDNVVGGHHNSVEKIMWVMAIPEVARTTAATCWKNMLEIQTSCYDLATATIKLKTTALSARSMHVSRQSALHPDTQ